MITRPEGKKPSGRCFSNCSYFYTNASTIRARKRNIRYMLE